MCTHACDAGYVLAGGTTARTCDSQASWTGSDVVCSLTPPVLPADQVLHVFENATADAAVGQPVYAYHSSPGVAVTYLLVGGNDSTTNPLFVINVCSGQLRLVYAGLDANVVTRYRLEVEVRANADPLSAARANVTVAVEPVPHPPQVNDTSYVRSVYENATVGSTFGACATASDPDFDSLTYSAVVTLTSSRAVNVTSAGALCGVRYADVRVACVCCEVCADVYAVLVRCGVPAGCFVVATKLQYNVVRFVREVPARLESDVDRAACAVRPMVPCCVRGAVRVQVDLSVSVRDPSGLSTMASYTIYVLNRCPVCAGIVCLRFALFGRQHVVIVHRQCSSVAVRCVCTCIWQL